MKKILSFFVCAMMMFSTISSINAKDNVNITGTYDIYVEGYDWVCTTRTITLTLSQPLDNVTTETFNVVEHSEGFSFETNTIEPKEETRVVENVITEGNTVVLTLAVSPTVSSPVVWSLTTQYNTYVKDYYFDITLKDESVTSNGLPVQDITIDRNYTNKTTAADNFAVDTYQASDVMLLIHQQLIVIH